MPCWEANRASAPFAKFVPLSVMMLCGTPYLTMMSAMNLAAVGPSSFLIGLASIHLVNLSTATSKCVMPPLAVLNDPTMSRPQTANGHVIGMVLSAEAGKWLFALNLGHPLQCLTRSSAAAFAVGQ